MPNPSRNDEWEELVLSCYCCCCCFFFSAKRFFALLSSTFMRVVFTTVNFEDK